MQHIEEAGVHSGDSACTLPAYSLSKEIQDVIRKQVTELAFELGVIGLMNTQMAVKNNQVYLALHQAFVFKVLYIGCKTLAK